MSDMPALDDPNSAALALDDAGILAVAVALCWHARPAFLGSEGEAADAQTWWRMQTETGRRLHLSRARVACAAWEDHWTKNAVG